MAASRSMDMPLRKRRPAAALYAGISTPTRLPTRENLRPLNRVDDPNHAPLRGDQVCTLVGLGHQPLEVWSRYWLEFFQGFSNADS